MPVIISAGAQWGDEGKGKVADVDSANADVVVRYQGGNNTGRTVVNEYGKEVLHIVPTGIFREKICIIEKGVALHPPSFIAEIESLRRRGVPLDNLKISYFAHLVMPWHIVKDRGKERSGREGKKIGTTGQGIGPCYQDKMGRSQAIRVADMLDARHFAEKIQEIYHQKSAKLSHYGELPPIDEVMYAYMEARELIVPFVTDTWKIIKDFLRRRLYILLEGAQAILLDVDHGTYPHVTSSSTGSTAALMYTGISPDEVEVIKGVAKAYVTRVGEGPFPTEIHGGEGDLLREEGHEYGSTTGRPRRCGWLDLPLLRYATEVLHATELALTKLDVVGKMHRIKVCTGYRGVSEIGAIEFLNLESQEPEYIEMEGWGELGNPECRDDLPENARRIINMVEDYTGIPVTFISTGPERSQYVR